MKIEITDGSGLPEGVMEEWAPVRERPDARVVVRDGGGVKGHVALWWREVPSCEGEVTGVMGGFFAVDEAGAKAVLEAGVERLSEEGCSFVVGPMNGNTWRRYRFVEEKEDAGLKTGAPGAGVPGAFFLEPRNDGRFPEWWREAGFEEVSRYSSSMMELDGTVAVDGRLRERLSRGGLAIRGMDAGRYDEELREIHRLSLKSFSGNFLYTPLEDEAFLESYRKVKGYVDPELVLLAEREGRLCGFVFGIADLEAVKRGEKPALIVKTLAVDPDSRSAGLGSLLVDELHRRGREKGFTKAIHALQHERNTSLKITGRHEGKVFRRYVLFGKRVGK